jgi:hypothetical protein
VPRLTPEEREAWRRPTLEHSLHECPEKCPRREWKITACLVGTSVFVGKSLDGEVFIGAREWKKILWSAGLSECLPHDHRR